MSELSSGLVLEGEYSLSIAAVGEMPSAAELAMIDKDNEKFLRTSATWQDPVEMEELDSVGLELRRQDMKINLLMDMVSELLMRQSELPPPESIKLTPTGIEFSNEAHGLETGAMAKIVLYILPALPRALQFYGEVKDGEQQGSVRLEFLGTGVVVHDQIEKLLFTHHRRSIAQVHASNKEAEA